MRRRRKKRNYLFINIVLISLLVLTTFGISYSYLSSSLNIRGTVKGTPIDTGYVITKDSNPNLTANVNISSREIEGGLIKYEYILNVKNISMTTLDNFTVTVTFRNNIESSTVVDYDSSLNKKVLTITNTKYDIKPNQTLSIIFTVYAKTTNAISVSSLKLEAVQNATEVALAKFPVTFVITNSSGSYIYQYNVTVTNKTGKRVTFWQLNIELPLGTTYISGTNAIFSTQESTLIVKSTSSNGRIDNNKTTTFGLQLSTDIPNYIPNNIRVFVR